MASIALIVVVLAAITAFGWSRVRAEQARTAGTLHGLDPGDARLVRLAVHDGRPVDRADLAPAAAAYATALLADADRPRSWRRWSPWLVAAGASALVALSVVRDQRAAALVWVGLGAWWATSQQRHRRDLQRALAANGG